MANVFIEESTMQAIGDAIRNKTGKSEGILPSDMPIEIENIPIGGEDYNEGYQLGKEQGKIDWLNDYQTTSHSNYLYAFAGNRWTDTLYNPQHSMLNLTHTGSMYAYSNITDTKMPIGIKNGQTTNVGQTFQYATKLVTIREFIVHPTLGMTSQFLQCSKLTNLTITGTIGKNVTIKDSPLLTKTSIQSLINSLSDTTTGLTATLNATAVNNAFETSTGAADGSVSDEWLALVATKSNWSIII